MIGMLRKWANGFMWTAWGFVFITMLLMVSFVITSNNELSVMTLGLIIAGIFFLISFLLFSWITIQKKTFAKTGWQLALTGGFLLAYVLVLIKIIL